MGIEDEQGKTLEALQLAIQMEVDGKEYYMKASRESDNEVGRELFQWLAAEEDSHLQKFEEIYGVIRSKKSWPDIDIEPGGRERLSTLFAGVAEKAGIGKKASSAELDAIARAMDAENKTRDLYQRRGEETAYDAERSFYEALAVEERGHYLALVDYREYLTDPAGWFASKEHPSLDGS